MSDEYFHEVFAIQAEILGEYRTQFRNALQTNLFKLTEKKIEIIKLYEIGIGVSFDVFPGVRLSAGGKQTESQVLKNIEKLER